MKKREYKKRLKYQLRKAGIKLTDKEVNSAVDKYHGKQSPSIAIRELTPPSTLRTENRAKAVKAFTPILNACKEAFDLDDVDLRGEITKNITDLRSIACQIAHTDMGIEPTVVISEMLYLTTPAMVYHAASRGVKKEVESVIFKEKLDEIREIIEEDAE